MMSFDEEDFIPISLIKEFIFCPRIPWLIQNISTEFKKPLWVQQGKSYQTKREILFRKRPLFKDTEDSKFQRRCDVIVSHLTLKIYGKVDLVLENNQEIIPVEFKLNALKPIRGHILQLMGYGLCLEKDDIPCQRGIIITGHRQKRFEISFTSALRADFLKVLERLRATLQNPFLPESSASLAKCLPCEYQIHCQDRDL